MYTLREHRRTGTEGSTVALGARIAIENDHPRVDRRRTGAIVPGSTSFHGTGRYQLHLIDTLVDDWPYGTSRVALHHLVVAITVAAVRGDQTQAEADKVLTKLDEIAGWSNAGHPSAPDMAIKAYAIVATAMPLKVVLLVRHFVGHHERYLPGRGRVLLHKKVRANFDAPASTIHAQPSDLELEGPFGTDLDGFASRRSTMAHEFAHAFGLPDEYLDSHPFKDNDTYPTFKQEPSSGGPARPFENDNFSLMNSSRVPRLRYLWHHVRALNQEPALSAALGNRTFVAEYATFASRLYTRPLRHELKAVPPFAEPIDPWSPLKRQVMDEKRTEIFLYQLGEDEGSAGGLSGPSSDFRDTGDLPFHAMVLLRIHFDLKRAPKATDDDLLAAAKKIFELIPPGFRTVTPAFAVRRDGRPFAHALVTYQFGFGFSQFVPGPAVRLLIEPESSTAKNSLLLPDGDGPDILHVKPSQCTWALVRYALEMASTTTVGGATATDDTMPTAAQIAASPVDAAVATMLQDPAGFVRAWRSVMLKKR